MGIGRITLRLFLASWDFREIIFFADCGTWAKSNFFLVHLVLANAHARQVRRQTRSRISLAPVVRVFRAFPTSIRRRVQNYARMPTCERITRLAVKILLTFERAAWSMCERKRDEIHREPNEQRWPKCYERPSARSLRMLRMLFGESIN